MQRRLNPETSVNKPFKNVLCQERTQNFFQGGGTNFRHFFKRFFFGRFKFKQLMYSYTKNDSREFGGTLPRQFFENLHTAMGILVLSEQF